MANEIWLSYDSASVLYALVYRMTDYYIYDVGDTAFEAIGTWNDARAGECDIVMTAVGDMHFADFPTVAAGVYYVSIRLKAGANPDTDDYPVGQGVMYWDGAAEMNTSTLDTLIDAVKTDTAAILIDTDTIEADLKTYLDAIETAVIAEIDANEVLLDEVLVELKKDLIVEDDTEGPTTPVVSSTGRLVTEGPDC